MTEAAAGLHPQDGHPQDQDRHPPDRHPQVRPLLARLAAQPAATLLVLCLFVWLPGFMSLPPLDRDESRFAQASKQMVETGDYVDIRFGEGTRYNKPVGIYWLQALSTKLFGHGSDDMIWTYRLPSLLGGYIALLLLFFSVRAIAPPETALLAAVLLAATVLLTAETQIATTDAVLFAATMGAQAVLFRLYLAARGVLARPPGLPLLLAGWFAFAFGILVKGPVIAGVLGATALSLSLWDRDGRWLKRVRPLLGLGVIAAVVLPWAIAIAVESHGAFYKQSLGHDFAGKLAGGQESHGAPPGYYLALSTLTLWPAVLFALPGLVAGWRARTVPAVRFLLCWAGGTWLLFELVPTKLPHYILAAYPALSTLAALWLTEQEPGAKNRAARIISALQFAVGLVAIEAAAIYLPQRFGHGLDWRVVAASSCGAIMGGVALIAYLCDRRLEAAFAGMLSAVILIPLLTAGVAPELDQLWLSKRAAALVSKDTRPGDPSPVLAGYVEPSLIFLLGTDTKADTGAGAARIAARQGGLAVIEERERAAFLAELSALDTQAYAVDQLAGYDYSHGRKDLLTVYRVVPAAPAE